MENPVSWSGNSRPVWLIIPVVIVPARPNGLPIAITCSPTSSSEEFPIIRGLRGGEEEDSSVRFSTISITAISLKISVPVTFAVYIFQSTNVILTILASLTTCLLLIICTLLS